MNGRNEAVKQHDDGQVAAPAVRRRSLGRTGIAVSEIGLGCEHLQGQNAQTVFSVVDAALAAGINLMDVFMSEPQVRSDIGAALKGRRDTAVIQGHIGSVWRDGQYTRSRDLAECQRAFEDLLCRLGTDYIDVGMLHFVDTQEDYRRVFDSPLVQYAQDLKRQGVIRAIGMSSHDPVAALRAVQTGLIDVLLFSLNPAYDLLPEDTVIDDLFAEETYRKGELRGINPARARLYQACEAAGTAITVMKGLGAGTLLRAQSSPFGAALTPVQCVHYALTRPAVASVLVGCRTPGEVKQAVAYEQVGDDEKDYSLVLAGTPKYSMTGRCMYCNHCLPCPAHIDIAQVNKYLDLAQELEGASVPPTVQEHYLALEHTAQECLACGSCEGNCPFGVQVISRMEQAAQLFGK